MIETPRSIHLVMEYSDGGNVQQLVKEQRRLDEPTAKRILWQLLDAVEACHAQRVCHRDLKLENFVLDRSRRTVKLIDFGLSVVWATGQTLFKSYGTPCYTAPEIIMGKRYHGPNCDVWSLGVSLCTMLTGALPFQAIGATELNRRITRGQFHVPEYVSADAKDLLQRMLTTNPEARADLQAIREHAWFKGVGLPRAPPPLVRAPTGGADAPPTPRRRRRRRSRSMRRW